MSDTANDSGNETVAPTMTLKATVLNSPDPRALGAFYERLLGWPIDQNEAEWVTLKNPAGGPSLSFQIEELYVRPVWPAKAGEPQMMAHLDIRVEDLDAAVAWAESVGAERAKDQFQDDVVVMLDLDGHPFCLFR